MMLEFAFVGGQHSIYFVKVQKKKATHDFTFFKSFSVFGLRAFFDFFWHNSTLSFTHKNYF